MNSLLSFVDTIIVLDTETTGLSPVRDEIIEIGAARLRRNGESYVPDGELSFLVKLSPGRSLPYEIVRLTGITEDMLCSRGISKEDAADRFSDFIGGEKVLIVAYNAQFDLNFLYYFLRRCDRADCLKGRLFLDALTVFRDRRPYPHRLENAIEAYHLENAVNNHRALDDANATLKLLQAMGEEKDDLSEYIDLFGIHPRFGVSGKRVRSIRYFPQPYGEHPPLYELADAQIDRS